MPNNIFTPQERLRQLKQELKKYENAFRAKHGRAAEREEIRNDEAMCTYTMHWNFEEDSCSIGAKYGEYRALQKQRSRAECAPAKQQEESHSASDSTVLKERPANVMAVTPSKRKRDQENVETSKEVERTPACVRQALGPTPQKDGAVLGIFDLIPDGTPSKEGTTVLPSESVVGATPSKIKPSSSNDTGLSKTPQSSGKRFFLGAFAGTPLKRKSDDEIYTPSTAKRQFATPAFLRRSATLPTLCEESRDEVTSGPPFKKRGLVRSLSTIIQGLKKQEEQRMDDDWDIMNELEAEEYGEHSHSSIPKVLVEDSQAVEMPLGPDQGNESSEDEGDGDAGALDANGKPRKVWKKKGLKRQTRRVNMKPVLHKPRKAIEDGHSDSEPDCPDTVEETQVDSRKESNRAAKAEGEDERHDSHKTSTSNRPSAKDSQKAGKTAKKVAPQDHANFRRLNIKNKNSKAKGKGRFGRR